MAISSTGKDTDHVRCGYPLCPFYKENAQAMQCPMPIQGSPCEGLGNPYEHYYGIDKPID
jgi:hypothetical protein